MLCCKLRLLINCVFCKLGGEQNTATEAEVPSPCENLVIMIVETFAGSDSTLLPNPTRDAVVLIS